MLYVLLVFIGLLVGGYLLVRFSKLALMALACVLGLVAALAIGPPVLLALLIEKVSHFLRLRWVMPVLTLCVFSLLVMAVGVTGNEVGLIDDGFAYYRSLIICALALSTFVVMLRTRKLTAVTASHQLLLKRQRLNWFAYYSSLMLAVMAIYSPPLTEAFDTLYGWDGWLGAIYWTLALLAQLYVIADCTSQRSFCHSAFEYLASCKACDTEEHCAELSESHFLDEDVALGLYLGCIALLADRGVLNEYQVLSTPWVINRDFDNHAREQLQQWLAASPQLSVDDAVLLTTRAYPMEPEQARDFLEYSLGLGSLHGFADKAFFVPFQHAHKLNVCVSCGTADLGDTPLQGEYYCSSTCEKTEQLCGAIKDKPMHEFVSSAASSGLVLMAGGAALDSNYKLFADGGQGHGFAAEHANHRIDKLLLKKAKLVGGDNAKNGADRLVNGQELQTKYCGTAARSVGAGFDGQQGNYKYFDAQGKPMPLEVPKDQYEGALATMKNKIKQGKVPGVSDPEQAKELIVKGHLTYDQARNITKFGTVESVTYDITEGAVVAAAAGGISFAISAGLYYASTGNKKQALKVAAIQGGKTFGRSLTVYVGTQQLNRLVVVQQMLGKIDISTLSASKRALLQKGFGVTSTNSVNKALRGTVITSLVLIAVTTGPDLVKMIRGRISKAQFAKNLAVVSSGVAGGTIGSIAGGIAFAPLGPVGALLGRVAGGVVGGALSSFAANKIAGRLMEEDRTRMIKLVQAQLEYLSVSFMLTRQEMENLNQNLSNILQPKSLELIHAAKSEQRALANLLLKPVVVSVIKQRPALTFDQNDVLKACEDIAA